LRVEDRKIGRLLADFQGRSEVVAFRAIRQGSRVSFSCLFSFALTPFTRPRPPSSDLDITTSLRFPLFALLRDILHHHRDSKTSHTSKTKKAMSNLDHNVAAVLDRAGGDSDVDEDDLIAELENDDTLDALREKRLQQLHEEVSRQKLMRQSEHGTYQEIKDEKALMNITTSTKLCVVHFFKPDFNRCRIMDKHIEVGWWFPVAARTEECRFIMASNLLRLFADIGNIAF